MSLSDRFSEAPVPQGSAPRRVRSETMKGFEPGVRVGSNGEQIVTTPDLLDVLGNEEAWREQVEALGLAVPAGWVVRLVEMRHDPAAWTRDDSSQEKAVTRPVWRYRFRVEPAGPGSADIEELIVLTRQAPVSVAPVQNGGEAFVVAIGDTQFGKVDGDGLEGTIKRVLESTENAVDRLNDLHDMGHRPEVVYICWLGDCIEGFVSQGGGNAWRTPTTLTEQVRIARRLMLHMIDQFRQLVPRVVLLSIPGNHDEAVRSNTGKVTRYDDSWAVEAAVAVSDAMEINPEAYGHCSVKVPGRDELTLTVDMAGTIVGLAHGHQVGRSGKAHEWWANQAHGLQPIGEAVLLLTAHFHHLRVEQPGAKTWIQVPAMESESTWWRHQKGQVSPAGVVTLLVGGGGWSDLQVV